MKEWLHDIVAPFAPILFGLLAGSSAHFGQIIARGERPKPHEIVGFVMQLGLVGLVVLVVIDLSGIKSPLMASFIAAVLALPVNEVVNWARARAMATLRQIDPAAGKGDKE